MNKKIITSMVKVANELDKMGFYDEASDLTKLAYDFSNPEKEELVDDSLSMGDEFEELHRILEELRDSGEITDLQLDEVMDIVSGDDDMDLEDHDTEMDDDDEDNPFGD